MNYLEVEMVIDKHITDRQTVLKNIDSSEHFVCSRIAHIATYTNRTPLFNSQSVEGVDFA